MLNLRFLNILSEAKHAHESGHDGQALLLLDEARSTLMDRLRPEDDPTRSKADREAWRAARG